MNRFPYYPIALVLAAFCLSILFPTLFLRTDRTDLGILLLGGERLSQGERVYQVEDPNPQTKPPFINLIFWPISKLSWFWLERLWDITNLILVWLIGFYLVLRLPRLAPHPLFYTLIGLTMVLNPFNAEIRMGQYNLFTLLLILVGTSRFAYLGGAATLLALLLKPTNLLFLPWVFRYQSQRKQAFLGGLGLGLGLVGIYLSLFGWQQTLLDHLEWMASLPVTTANHLLRHSNFGLPSLLGGNFQDATWFLNPLLLISGFLISLRLSQSAGRWESLALIATLIVIVSPMAWLQNYVFLLPWMLVALDKTLETRSKIVGIALAVLYASTQFYNPTFGAWGLLGPMIDHKLPLFGVLIAWPLYFYGTKKVSARR